MISSYRLGDLVLKNLNKEEINEILKDHPHSIGTRYLYEKLKYKRISNIDVITRVVVQYIRENIEKLPKDIRESTVIHLRLGDVIAGNEWHEKEKRPMKIEEIKTLAGKGKKYVIGRCFFAKLSSTNYEECIEESNKYLNDVLKELNCEHYDSGNADIDLCCAVMSKLFIQGKGHYSQLIREIRNRLGLQSK